MICFDDINQDGSRNMTSNSNILLISSSSELNTMFINNNCIIQLQCDISIKNKINLLVDTGATVSLIKVDVLKDEVRISSSKAMTIQGIFNVSTLTIGEAIATLQIKKKFHICPFQVIASTESINIRYGFFKQ